MSRNMLAPAARRSAVNSRDSGVPAPKPSRLLQLVHLLDVGRGLPEVGHVSVEHIPVDGLSGVIFA